MSDLSPQQIAAADQWLAGLRTNVREPLENARQMFSRGDHTQVYAHLSQTLTEMMRADPVWAERIAYSYVAVLYLILREGWGSDDVG